MGTIVVKHVSELPPIGKIFYVLPKAIIGLPEGHDYRVDGFVPIVRSLETGTGIQRVTVEYLVCTNLADDDFDHRVTSVDMAHWFMPKDYGYELNVLSKRPDGMPISDDERALRRLLCAAHDPSAYMDDGEAQSTIGIDYMRTELKQLCIQIMEHKHETVSNQLKQLKAAGIPFDLENRYNPIEQISKILAKIKPGEPVHESVFNELIRVKQYLSIAHPGYDNKG